MLVLLIILMKAMFVFPATPHAKIVLMLLPPLVMSALLKMEINFILTSAFLFARLKLSLREIIVLTAMLIVKNAPEEIRTIIALNAKDLDTCMKTNVLRNVLITFIKIQAFKLVNRVILDAKYVLNQLI